MVNYKDGKIYKLVGGGLTYIGSTTQRLSKRKSQHKTAKKRICTSNELVKYDDFDIILIEKFPCESKEELHARERYYIENTECVNKNIPTRTNKEYKKANKEEIKKKQKEYKEANKDKIRQKNKAYKEANKEEIKKKQKEYREANKDKIRQKNKKYQEANKERITQKKKTYYEKNKERIIKQQKAYRESNKKQHKNNK